MNCIPQIVLFWLSTLQTDEGMKLFSSLNNFPFNRLKPYIPTRRYKALSGMNLLI